ncbi:MAG: hypothetical protein JXM70_01540 [Pirellulales bacterium]|nr:hypothetical protein [Pirellulales bacterium]
MKWQRPIKCILLAVAAIATTLVAFNIEVSRDWAFICENTGSRKGYRQWSFGPKTGHWHEKSPLEEFVAEHKPDALAHRWTSYAGTGKNIFGSSLSFGHGSPGAVLQFEHSLQDWWIERHSEEEVIELYGLFVYENQTAIDKTVTEIWEEYLK